MTKLQCYVTSCAFNSTDACCRPSIKVDGPTAHTSQETCCQSFAESTNQFSSGGQYDSPNDSLSIQCDASHCTYNENRSCSANSIRVDVSSGGTECSSFKEN